MLRSPGAQYGTTGRRFHPAQPRAAAVATILNCNGNERGASEEGGQGEKSERFSADSHPYDALRSLDAIRPRTFT